MFYGDHNLDLDKAAAWMDAAIAAQPDAFYLLYHKARILAKMGDKAGAEARPGSPWPSRPSRRVRRRMNISA